MDDFMVYPPCPCCTERAEYCSQHALKLEVLHLFASLLLDKNDDAWWNQLNNSSSSGLTKCSLDLAEALQSVLVEIRATGQQLLEQFLSGLSGARSVSTFSSQYASHLNKGYRIIARLQIFLAFRRDFVKFSLRVASTTLMFGFSQN